MHVLFVIFAALIIFPVLSAHSAEFSDTPSTLVVTLDNESPYVYRDQDGYVVVVGQVINNDELASITNVQIRASFYDETGTEPIAFNTAGTVLDVIPPMGSSPYVIRSQSPDATISHVSVDLDRFKSSPSKLEQHTVESSDMLYNNNVLSFTGVLKNTSAPTHDTNVHVAFYDNFDPPRILNVYTIPLGSILPNDSHYFDFNEKINPRSTGFYLFSESDIFYSDFVSVTLPEHISSTKLITIQNVSVVDDNQNTLSDIFVGSHLNIYSESWIQFSADQLTNETPYTYYAQVTRLGDPPYVEFLGEYNGRYLGTGPQPNMIDWIPTSPGAFFIETFVWDRDNVPIANPGPIKVINVQ